MTLPVENSRSPEHALGDAGDAPDGATGLPWPRTWRGVYWLVIGSFVTWVTLLVVLERAFS